MHRSDLETWQSILQSTESELSIAEVALSIAQDEYPGLVVADYTDRLDRLADRVASRFDRDSGLRVTMQAMHRCLFDEDGYDGNRLDYYDPRNSYLNEVMDRRLGIPLTLALIYIEVANRLQLPVSGVAFPGHFLVKWSTPDGEIIVDPYTRGEVLGIDQLNRLLRSVYGDSAPSVQEIPGLMAASSKKAMLVRLLRNLKQIYQNARDDERVLRILDKLLVVDPKSRIELRERALIYESSECYRAALYDLERYRDVSVDGADVADDAEVETCLRRLRQMLSSYH